MTRFPLSSLLLLGLLAGCHTDRVADEKAAEPTVADVPASHDQFTNGKEIFRFDNFGNQHFWTDTLRLHEIIQAKLDPLTALTLGLKVDAEALPPGLLGQVDLTDPKTTVALLQLDAVLGLKARVENGRLVSFGVTCALCHSTVDNSVQAGIGRRKDGWPNRDLDVGAIIALSPALTDAQRAVYSSWGPGRYDPRFNIDGKNTPIVLPPAYGLAHVKNETYTADGPISYWNDYVAVTQMHGQGTFIDPRLGIAVRQTPDLVEPKLPAPRDYQLSLPTPPPPQGSVNRDAARRGLAVFNASCARCHIGGSGTDNNQGVLHQPGEIGVDGSYAARTVNKAYRTTPLRGLWQHPPYFHDGSAPTLAAVISHYDAVFQLGLSSQQRQDLEEYLKTL